VGVGDQAGSDLIRTSFFFKLTTKNTMSIIRYWAMIQYKRTPESVGTYLSCQRVYCFIRFGWMRSWTDLVCINDNFSAPLHHVPFYERYTDGNAISIS